MGKANKKYRAAAEMIDATRAYDLEEGLGLVCALLLMSAVVVIRRVRRQRA